MPLGVIPMILFFVLRIFGKKSQKGAKRKTRQKWAPSPQRGLPRHCEAEGQKRPPPRLRYDVALLRRRGALHRSITTLR